METSMDSRTEHRGGCLCGAVGVIAKPTSDKVVLCHCKMCRQWGGGPMFAAECEQAVTFEGEAHIARFQSSSFAERGFCKICGTHLFFRYIEENHYALPVGLLDDSDAWTLSGQIFIDRKPSFFSFAEETENLTEDEVLNP
jgi:hypothetical protein